MKLKIFMFVLMIPAVIIIALNSREDDLKRLILSFLLLGAFVAFLTPAITGTLKEIRGNEIQVSYIISLFLAVVMIFKIFGYNTDHIQDQYYNLTDKYISDLLINNKEKEKHE